MKYLSPPGHCLRFFFLLTTAWLFSAPANFGAGQSATSGKICTTRSIVSVERRFGPGQELTLARDRARMIFDGHLYFPAPVNAT